MQRNILSSAVKLTISLLSRFTSRLKAEQILPLISLAWNQKTQRLCWCPLEKQVSFPWLEMTPRDAGICPRDAELLLVFERYLCSCTLFSLLDTHVSCCFRVHAQSLWRAEHIVLNTHLSSFLCKIQLAKKALFPFVLVEIRAEPDQSRYICARTYLALRTTRNGVERSTCKQPSLGSSRFSSGTWD